MAETDAVSILLYGESGIGKTTDVGYVFRKAVWLQTEPGGLHPVLRSVGYTPDRIVEIFDIERPDKELEEGIAYALALKKEKLVTSVVLDTGSEIADRMLVMYLKKFRDPRQAYTAIQHDFTTSIRRLVGAGLWFIMICHEIAPEVDTKTGAKLRGGPMLPGRRLPRALPPKFDIVLRADIDDSGLDGSTRVYRCNPLDANWIMKDRLAVTEDVQPMELAPLVYRIKYPGKPVPAQLFVKRLKRFV
jgi:hypothetical protein